MKQETQHRFGTVRKFADNVEETRTIEFVISTNTEDRHGTVLNMQNWNLDNFNKNGIVGYQHNVYGGDMCNGPDPDQVIGRGEAFLEGDNLIGRVTFEPKEINELAEKIFRKILYGTLKATSVGFIPLKNEKGKTGQYGRADENGDIQNENTYFYHGQELLEFSIVNIPSNPDALKRAIRSQSANALTYVHRALGGKLRFSEIEKLRVSEIIDMMEGNEITPDNTANELQTANEQIKTLKTKIKNLELDKKYFMKKALEG